MPHIQIHAARFGGTDEERQQPLFNDHPAVIQIADTDVVEITVKEGTVFTKINGEEQMQIPLGEWLYTAFAICYD